MGLEKIKEEILQKSALSEKSILAEADSKVAKIKAAASEKIKQLEQEAAQKLQAETKSIESRETSLANMESQKMLFEVKKDILDKTYAEAFEKIKNMPKKDREQTIQKLFEAANKEIDVSVVQANDLDKDFLGSEVKVESLDGDGGIICETKDGNIRVNLTFQTIFDDLKEKTVKETSKILFG
jgi:V/A-type H+-transporting ATPase subunit E|tara:strand:+ start:31 stop:579 length:549 start_codon:yes stop_codon:yes gene_type:complete